MDMTSLRAATVMTPSMAGTVMTSFRPQWKRHLYLFSRQRHSPKSGGGTDEIRVAASTGLTSASVSDLFRQGQDLIIQLDNGDFLTIDGQFIPPTSNRLETITFLLDSSFISLTSPEELKTYGTAGNDVLNGSDLGSAPDILYGNGGHDKIYGKAGDDFLYGGSGHDFLRGGSGNDTLDGGTGDDELVGEMLSDSIGNDKFIASNGHDIIYDGGGDDSIAFGPGTTFADLSLHRYYLNSGVTANDLVIEWDGQTITISSQFDPDATVETLLFETDPSIDVYDLQYTTIGSDDEFLIDPDYVIATERIWGVENTEFNQNDIVYARGGDDEIFGGAGADVIYGGKGNDQIFGGYGFFSGTDTSADVLFGDEGDDNIDGGDGDDNIDGGDGDDDIEAGDGNDYVYGESGVDNIYGDDGDDYLDGGNGDDYFEGGQGNDLFYGGAGDDYFVSEQGTDTISDDSGVEDYVSTGHSHTLTAVQSGSDLIFGNLLSTDQVTIQDQLDGKPIEWFAFSTPSYEYFGFVSILNFDNWIFGSNDDQSPDTLTGLYTSAIPDDDHDVIFGYAGDDVINVGDGYNVVLAGDGNDTIAGGSDTDELYGGLGNDTIHAGSGDDILAGDEGNDGLYGQAGNDALYGNAGDDVLDGGEGDDEISPGEGVDATEGGGGIDTLSFYALGTV
ncbi:MAG: hypothetical protein IPK78_00630 [Rhodospirillales bacterium]|nr:hypothetical protein [Rhodospirillales bacterium]